MPHAKTAGRGDPAPTPSPVEKNYARSFRSASAILLLAIARPAFAHNDIVTSSVVTVGPDRIECRMKIAMPDVLKADGIPAPEIPTASEELILAAVGRIVEHVRTRLVIRDDEGDHPMTLQSHDRIRTPDPETESFLWTVDRLVLRWTFEGTVRRSAVLRSLLFEELGLGHRNAVILRQGDQEKGEWLLFPRETLPLGGENLEAAAEASRRRSEPVHEVPAGFRDGLLSPFRRVSLAIFLAALFLVPAGSETGSRGAGEPGIPGSPVPRVSGSPIPVLRPTFNFQLWTLNFGLLMTSFVLAMVAKRREWISAPDRFLDTAVFLTAGYTAFENLFAGGGRGRWILALLFGPVHGLAFAGGIPAAVSPLFHGGAALSLSTAGIGLSLIASRLGCGLLRGMSVAILILSAAGLAVQFIPLSFFASWR